MGYRIKMRVSGVGFVVVLALLIGLAVASYQKKFTKVIHVTLVTDFTGNQLQKQSDVKVRGIEVGQVRDVKATTTGATVSLALDPGKVALIPDNTQAQLLPKTLFGEQYVALILPTAPQGQIHEGATIKQDSSVHAAQVSDLLRNIQPVLNALNPAELNATLTAVATALRGRGDQIGQSLVELDTYLKQLNPSMPQLATDVVNFGRVAATYTAALPDILSTLDNFETTTRTITARSAALATFLKAGTSATNALTAFFNANGNQLIQVAATSVPVLNLLAEYSPIYTCVLSGVATLNDRAQQAFSGGVVKVNVYPTQAMGRYQAGDQPKFVSGAPDCHGLPGTGRAGGVLNDGAAQTGGAGSGAQVTPGGTNGSLAPNSIDVRQLALASVAERQLVSTVISGQYGSDPNKVPDVATIIATPILKGTTVEVSGS